MRGICVAAAVLILSGCQTAHDGQGDLNAVLTSLQGRSVEYFTDRNPEFSLADVRDTANGRAFVFDGRPVVTTVTSPSYTPARRRYNDPAFGAAMNDLSAAVGTTPEYSRSTVQVCRLIVHATHAGGSHTAANWTIERIEPTEACG